MARLLSAAQVLPVTIAAIGLVMGVRVVALVGTIPGLGGLAAGAAVITQAQAAASQHDAPAEPAAAHPAPPPAASPATAARPVADAIPELPMPAPLPTRPPPAARAAAAPVDSAASLEALKLRRSQNEERERQLTQREATLSATDKRLTERVAELVALQSRLQELESGLKERDQANWGGMVKTYEGMRPRDAAAIFNALEKNVLLEVLDRMKPAKAAPVLAAMDPEKARQATSDLAARRTRATATN